MTAPSSRGPAEIGLPPLTVREILVLLVVAITLACFFWWPLPLGGGIIGGDTYNYFFPLKDFYAQGLAQGEIRLWHTGIGNGVNVLGESQTGVFYPFNLLFYRLLDLNSAYSAIFLLHYVLAYVWTYLLARSYRVTPWAGHLAALVFTYGWFPPRACLEWSIVTGSWLPAALLATRGVIVTRRIRWAVMLALVTTIQLLAGHFNLAWITTLSVLFLAFATLISRSIGWRQFGAVILCLVSGYLMAAFQLIPAWELKEISQRSEIAFIDEISQGLVPWEYLGQLVMPWRYYADPDAVLASLGAKTNKVEAHLYFGLVPLILAVVGIISGRTFRVGWPWLLLAIIAIAFAIGWLIPTLAALPGFGYFRYCGRYGLAAQMGVAILAALALDRLAPRRAPLASILSTAVLALSFTDFYLVGHQVQYATITPSPIINLREDSEVFARLETTDRVLAPDGNTLALSGAACVPPYLGIGPAEYYGTWNAFPNVFEGATQHSPELQGVLQNAGVTHLLTFKPLPADWPVQLVWSGRDAFLHPRWARDPSEPLYLYRYLPSRGRAFLEPVFDGYPDEGVVSIEDYQPHRVEIHVDAQHPCQLVLTDRATTDWRLSVDGHVDSSRQSGGNRSVRVDAGKHTVVWDFDPRGFKIGVGISLVTAILGAIAAFFARRVH